MVSLSRMEEGRNQPLGCCGPHGDRCYPCCVCNCGGVGGCMRRTIRRWHSQVPLGVTAIAGTVLGCIGLVLKHYLWGGALLVCSASSWIGFVDIYCLTPRKTFEDNVNNLQDHRIGVGNSVEELSQEIDKWKRVLNKHKESVGLTNATTEDLRKLIRHRNQIIQRAIVRLTVVLEELQTLQKQVRALDKGKNQVGGLITSAEKVHESVVNLHRRVKQSTASLDQATASTSGNTRASQRGLVANQGTLKSTEESLNGLEAQCLALLTQAQELETNLLTVQQAREGVQQAARTTEEMGEQMQNLSIKMSTHTNKGKGKE